jgi:ATP-dependent RNA helicase DDX49/DBP8
LNLRVTLLIGGMPLQQQLFSLTQIPHIVVATPGRCAELLRTDSLFQKNIQNIKFLVLDEVDRLMENQVWSQVEDVQRHIYSLD